MRAFLCRIPSLVFFASPALWGLAACTACTPSMTPDLVLGTSASRRRLETGRSALDVRGEIGLRFATSPRAALVTTPPPDAAPHALPEAPACHAAACAAERLGVERAWLVVVILLALDASAGAAHAQPSSAPRAAAVAPTDPVLVGEALAHAIDARFAHDPDVLAVVRAALDLAGLDPQRARDRVRRGRRSGWLPDLRVGAARQRGVAATSGQTSSDSTSRVGSDDSLRVEATLTFALSRLVYGQDEVTWSREERAIVDSAAALAREVVELYFRRRRLIVEIEFLSEDDAEHRVALAEVEALLEVFTAGSFSRMMGSPTRTP